MSRPHAGTEAHKLAEYDVIIRDTTIIDGSGAAAFAGSVAVDGEHIAAVGQVPGRARIVIDGSGLVTCPGFVDPHTHIDTSILCYPLAENLIMQGVTTAAGGNCGFSTAPVVDAATVQVQMVTWGMEVEPHWRSFGEWLEAIAAARPALNYVPLVGHSTIREAVMGSDWARGASPDEVAAMEPFVHEAMESGAFGLSAGLDGGWSGHFAGADELIALAGVARGHGGLFAPHTRHHQNQWPADRPSEVGYGIFHAPMGEIIAGRYHGLLEAVEIARLAGGVQLHIAHLTPAYLIPQPHPPFLDEAAARATLVDIVDRASDEGLDVTYNVVAWDQTVGSRTPIVDAFLGSHPLLPGWLRGLAREMFSEQLAAEAFRERVRGVVYSGRFKFGMLHPLTDPYWMDCYRVLECADTGYTGRTIGEIARERQPCHIIDAVYRESLETVFDILMTDPTATWALIKDKREAGALPTFLQHPAGMPCSDVQAYPATPPAGQALYGYAQAPIAYGLFPHYVRRFVRDLRALSLEQAVRQATSVPAQRVLHLTNRGAVREGAYADLLVFDPKTISEAGDFLDPARPPLGIEWVLVNGSVTYHSGAHTGARAGKVLRRGQP